MYMNEERELVVTLEDNGIYGCPYLCPRDKETGQAIRNVVSASMDCDTNGRPTLTITVTLEASSAQ